MFPVIFVVLLFLAVTITAIPHKKGMRPEDINLDHRINFGWCREKGNSSDTCGTRMLEHARCYDFKQLCEFLNDNLELVNVTGGRCVIWEKDQCHGDHTGMIQGNNIPTDNLCPGYPWAERSSSIKCCGGDQDAHWCADPGDLPKCTD